MSHSQDSVATELSLYIENDGQLHRQQGEPILKNLILKVAKGVYNHDGAVKLYMHLMESGAKKYVKEHGSGGEKEWSRVFSVTVRKSVAEDFAKSFETEAALGNYAHLLPKKYQAVAKKPVRRAAR
jgi:hypothetical protein